jgi:hypothetical protein
MAALLEEDFGTTPNRVAVIDDQHFVTGSSGAHAHTLLVWDFDQYRAANFGA